MTSLWVEVLGALVGAGKRLDDFSVGGAPNGPSWGPTGFGSAGAGSGTPGAPGDPNSEGDTGDGGDNGDDGQNGDNGDGDNSGDESKRDRKELYDPHNHEQGLPGGDDSSLDVADRTLWDALKNALSFGPAVGVLEAIPATRKAADEAQDYERKVREAIDQDHRGDAHLREQ